MKNILKIIVLMALFLASGAEVDNTQKVYAQESCEVTSVVYDKITGLGQQDFEDKFVNVRINTNNCTDGIKFQMKYFTDANTVKPVIFENLPTFFYPDKNNVIYFKIGIEESACDGDNDNIWGTDLECVTYTQIFNAENKIIFDGNKIIFDGNATPLSPTNIISRNYNSKTLTYPFGVLASDCSGTCDDDDNFRFVEIFNGTASVAQQCDLSPKDISFSSFKGSIKGQTPKLTIQTAGKCEGQAIKVRLYEEDTGFFDGDDTIDFKNKGGEDDEDEILVLTPFGKNLEIIFKSHEDDCDNNEGADPKNCAIYVELEKPNGQKISTLSEIQKRNQQDFETTINFTRGVILADCSNKYDCTNFSENDWDILDSTGEVEGINDDSDPPQILETVKPDFDENSPCYVASSTTPASDDGLEPGEKGIDRDCYEFLAPIPGFGNAQVINGQETGRVFIKLSTLKLGDYINTMFQIGLGILMVLSVVMIVVGGVQYMTSEAIFQKQVAKESITKAVVGLILGLGIFIILNTINPRLLEIDFGSNIQDVGIETIELSDAQIDFAANIDISGIQISDDLYTYEPLITYIYHQQGIGGGPSILWAAKNNLAALPSKTPFIKSEDASGINAKMAGNVSPRGTQVTPKEFLQFWYLRLKQKEKEINSISQNNPEHAKAIQTASNLTGVDVNILKTVCMVESYDCTDANAVNGSYSGLFQMGKDEFAKNGPANGNIFDPGDNSLAAARLAKNNLRAHQRNLKRINSGLDF